MTTEQAIIGILGPVAAFLAGVALKLLQRHFDFLDAVKAHLERSDATSAQQTVALVQITAAASEARAETAASQTMRAVMVQRLEEIEAAISIRGKLEEIAQRVSDPGREPTVDTPRVLPQREPTGRHRALVSEEAGRVIDRPGGYSQVPRPGRR